MLYLALISWVLLLCSLIVIWDSHEEVKPVESENLALERQVIQYLEKLGFNRNGNKRADPTPSPSPSPSLAPSFSSDSPIYTYTSIVPESTGKIPKKPRKPRKAKDAVKAKKVTKK